MRSNTIVLPSGVSARPSLKPRRNCVGPPVRPTKYIGSSPLSSAVKYKPLESGDHTTVFTQRSNPCVSSVAFPVVRSYSINRNRSLSYPPRDCDRKAMYLPSGEYIGVESAPGDVEIFFGVPPLTGTTKMSVLVLVASTSSRLLAYAISCPSGENAY